MLEGGFDVRATDPAHWFVVQQRVETDCLVDVALQYWVAIHRGHNSVDDLSAQLQRDQTHEHDDSDSGHQKVCPMLKKKLMRRSEPCSKICVPTGKCSSPGTLPHSPCTVRGLPLLSV